MATVPTFRPIAGAAPTSDDVALREFIAAQLAKNASAPRNMPAGTSTNQALGHGAIQVAEALMARNARNTAVESKNQYRDHLAKTNEPLVDQLSGGDAGKREMLAKAIAGMNPEVASQALSQSALNRALAVPDPSLALRKEEAEAARAQRMEELKLRLADGNTRAQEAADLRRELAQLQAGTQKEIAGMRVDATRDAAQAKIDAKKEDKDKGLSTTFDTYQQAADGLEAALGAATTGPLVGRVTALTAPQQTADGAVSGMAPVLKQIFRVAGEGSFSDRDQALLLEMVPTRKDLPEARAAKLANMDRIIRAKLGMPQKAGAAPAPAAAAPAAAGGDMAAQARAELARRKAASGG